MIQHPRFPVEPWWLCERELRLEWLAQTESVFALANGHVGLRGNLDEGEPFGLPGSYLERFYEVRPLTYPETGYAYPETGRSVVNVTNGKVIRLLVEDEPFDVRYGELRSHERVLDFRDGVLRRVVEWVSPTGRIVRISSTRLVSFTQRAVAAVAGFGGMREHDGSLAFTPRLPPALSRLTFRLCYRGRRLRVDVGKRKPRTRCGMGRRWKSRTTTGRSR